MLDKIQELRTNIINNISALHEIDEYYIIRNYVYEWFQYYQGDMKKNKLLSLYYNLIEEEKNEFKQALKKQDVIEMLDAIVDIFWVECGYNYFLYGGEMIGIDIARYERNYDLWGDYFKLGLIEVAYSNWTKSKQRQTDGVKAGKIIKGPNYKKPDINLVFKLLNNV